MESLKLADPIPQSAINTITNKLVQELRLGGIKITYCHSRPETTRMYLL